MVLIAAAAGAGFDLEASAQPSSVPLRVSHTFDFSGGQPIEGFVSYLVVRRKRLGRGFVVSRIEMRGDLPERAVTLRLVPGRRYRLSSYQRPCSGNCDQLDPILAGCAREFRATRRLRDAVIAVAFGQRSRCRITLR